MSDLYIIVEADTNQIIGYGNTLEGQIVEPSEGQLLFNATQEQFEKAMQFNKYDFINNVFLEKKKTKVVFNQETYNAVNLEYLVCMKELGL